MERAPFEIIEPSSGEGPVIVEIPHAGLDLYAQVLGRLCAPARAIARDADLFVDELYLDAPSEGATVLVANASRYVLDLNRAEDDVDSGVVAGDSRPCRQQARGLIWRTTTDEDLALERPLSREEYLWRLSTVYHPYHSALRALIERKTRRFGYTILLCAHSMPSVGRAGHADGGIARADVVPGTRGRTSAHRSVIDGVEAVAVAFGRSVEHDAPYRGGFSTTNYGNPKLRCHAIQIELARRLYLDEAKLSRRKQGIETTRELCRAFVQRLASLPSRQLAES